MQHITANTARSEFESILNNVVKHGDSISIATDDGAAILVSQEEWNGMLETLYLQVVPGISESIKKGMETPLSECVPLSEVWPDV